MENIENNLNENIIESELFSFDNIIFDKIKNLYQLNMTKTSFDKLVNFFEKFLTNRNFKNIDDVETLLKLISELKNLKIEEIIQNEVKEEENLKNNDFKNINPKIVENLSVMINKTSVDSVKEICIKTKEDMEKYIIYLDEKEKEIFLEEEKRINEENKIYEENNISVDYSLIEEQYKNTWILEIEKMKNIDELKKKREIEDIEKNIKETNHKPLYYLKIGDILKGNETEYEIIKIYNSDNLVSDIVINDDKINDAFLILNNTSGQNIEKMFNLKQLDSFIHNGMELNLIKSQIETDYNEKIEKIINIKKSTIEMKKDILKLKKYHISDFTELNNNINKSNSIINDNLTCDEMKNMFSEIKHWIAEAEINYMIN